jgi:catechol 2,3-dioxygenase-like lactoylglutathione lyase family enzyme
MRIYITSVFVEDQAKALDFYTSVLGFVLKHDEPIGDDRLDHGGFGRRP